MADYYEVKVDSIRVSLTTQQRVLILHESVTDLYLPIWVGSFEAESIVIALQEIEVSRPQPHDLLKNVIASLNGKLENVVLSKIQDDTFYSFLVITKDETQIKIDSRPSDAISLAIRCNVPILVDLQVLQTAGIQPEVDIRSYPRRQNEPGFEFEDETELQKLTVFDDFLKNLDLSDKGDDGNPDQLSDDDNQDEDDNSDAGSNDLLYPL